MIRRLLLITICLLTISIAEAKLKVTTEADGTVVLTLEASGDINGEFTNIGYASYKASPLLKPYLNATKMKIVTPENVKLSDEDLKRITGMEEQENNFPQLATLDMKDANVEHDATLVKLNFMDKLKTFTFPKTTTEIPQYCFANGSCKIEHVIIPDNPNRSVTIGVQAFGSSLKSIVLGAVNPNGNSTIKQQAFLGCTNLYKVDFHFGWKTIGTQSFSGCTALKHVVLPEGVETIGDGAFSGAAIETIHLPSTLKRIEANAFVCRNLKSITIPASVEYIETFAFQGTESLTDVYVLGTKTKAGNQAFPPQDVSNFICNKTTGKYHLSDLKRSGNGKPITVLHYPEAAKDYYINEYSKKVGGRTKSVLTEEGDIMPTLEDGMYSIRNGDYAGWQNFAATTKGKKEEIWEDSVRVDDKWYSMCLPFDMTKIQLESAYGSEVEVVEFSNAYTKNEGTIKYLHLEFKKPVTETKAHHPYMIHPSLHAGTQKGVKTTIVGIKKKPESESSLETVVKTVNGINYKFIGNYTKNKVMPAPCYFYYNGAGATNGTFASGFYKRTKTGGKWGQYSAIVIPSSEDGVHAKAYTVFYDAGHNPSTGIANINAGSQTLNNDKSFGNRVMNLNGQTVRQGSDALSGLPAGIYIVNGKKYVVR